MAPAPRQKVGWRAVKISFCTAALLILGAAVWLAIPRPQPPPPPVPVRPAFMPQFLAKEATVYSPGTNAGEVVTNCTTPVQIEMRIAEFKGAPGSILASSNAPEGIWLLDKKQWDQLLAKLNNTVGVDLVTKSPKVAKSGQVIHDDFTVQQPVLMPANGIIYTNRHANLISKVETVTVPPPGQTNQYMTNFTNGVVWDCLPELLTTGGLRLGLNFNYGEFLGYGLPPLIASQKPALAGRLARTPSVPLPQFRLGHWTNQMILQPGQTAVCGPLAHEVVRKSRSQVAGLGDIPWIGRLFRRERTETNEIAEYLIITPHWAAPPAKP